MDTKDNTKNIADLLPEAITKNLSDESLSALKEEFENLVESKVAERLAVATAAAEA
jgi:predicted house-cleaning noncanonical NTP pyrophosphatase (MazG superfamily)